MASDKDNGVLCNIAKAATTKVSHLIHAFDPISSTASKPCSIASMLLLHRSNDDNTNNATTSMCDYINGLTSSTSLSLITSTPNPQQPTLITSVAARIESVMERYLSAIAVGAAMGAAVVAGLGIGIVSALGLFSGIHQMPLLLRTVYSTIQSGWNNQILCIKSSTIVPSETELLSVVDPENTNRMVSKLERNNSIMGQKSSPEMNDDVPNIRSHLWNDDARRSHHVSFFRWNEENPILVLHGIVQPSSSSNHHSTIHQIRDCFQSVDTLLRRYMLQWEHVRQITAYLIYDACHASTFRSMLNEYLVSNNNHPTTIITVIYVSKLENEHSCLQLDVMACCSSDKESNQHINCLSE